MVPARKAKVNMGVGVAVSAAKNQLSFSDGCGRRDGYQDNFLPTGLPFGSPEDCLDCAGGLYLDTPA